MIPTINEMVQMTLESGIEPLQLAFDAVKYFDSKNIILRSSLIINSLDLGVLRHREYRYVARRRKKGDELTARHLRKLLDFCPELLTNEPGVECVTFPASPQNLISGCLRAMLFEQLAAHAEVSPGKICVELSADLLYEDTQAVRRHIEELRTLGVKVAIFELGDEYCPVFKLADIPFDYAFADGFSAELLTNEEIGIGMILPKMVHLLGGRIFAPVLEEKEKIIRAGAAEYDGYGVSVPFELNKILRDEDSLEACDGLAVCSPDAPFDGEVDV